MNAFQCAVADVLEVTEIGLDDDFRAVDGWCSLKGFGLLVLMENDWNAPMTIDRFLTMRTVRDLMREAFLSFAASFLGVSREQVTAGTAYQSLPQWDSVNHLRLVMETENRFGLHYDLERIPNLLTLGDFIA